MVFCAILISLQPHVRGADGDDLLDNELGDRFIPTYVGQMSV